MSVIKTWVDAAYGVHNQNMRSQTGVAIMMGKGVLYSHPENNQSMLKVPPKRNWLALLTACHKQFGLKTLLRHKVTRYITIFFIRII